MKVTIKPDGKTVEITLADGWRFLYYEGEPLSAYNPHKDRFLVVECEGAEMVMLGRFVFVGAGVLETVEPEELARIIRRVRCGSVHEPKRKSERREGGKIIRRVNL